MRPTIIQTYLAQGDPEVTAAFAEQLMSACILLSSDQSSVRLSEKFLLLRVCARGCHVTTMGTCVWEEAAKLGKGGRLDYLLFML